MQFTRATHHSKTLFTTKFAWENEIAFWHHRSWKSYNGFNPTRALGSPCNDLHCLVTCDCNLADVEVVTIWMSYHLDNFTNNKLRLFVIDNFFFKSLPFAILGSNERLAHLSKILDRALQFQTNLKLRKYSKPLFPGFFEENTGYFAFALHI